MLGLLRLGISIDSRTGSCSPATRWRCRWRGSLPAAAAPASAPLALLLLPLVWSWFAVQGLYNYVLSLPPALVWLGIVARDGARPRPVAALALAVVGPGGLSRPRDDFSVLLLVTAIRIASPADGSRLDSKTAAARLGAAGPVTLALLPSLLLAAASWRGGISASAPSEATVSSWEMYDFPSAVGAFFVEFAMRYHLLDLVALGPPLLVLIGAPLLARRAGANPGAPRWPLHAAGVLALLYLLSPHIVLGSDLTPRLRPLLVFSLLCYGGVALSPLGPTPRGPAGPRFGPRRRGAPLPRLPQPRPRAGRLLVGNPVRASGQPRLPGDLRSRSPSILVKPFLHAWGYYGLARDVVTPYAFAWHATRFPYRYRELPLHPVDSAFPSDAEDEPYALIEGRLCASVRRFSASLSCERFVPWPRRESWPSERRTTICSPGPPPPTFGR